MGWEYTGFQREELYEQVWTEAVSKVAKQYGISDVGLRKKPVAQARQLMLTHSISYLPWWREGKWMLLSETGLLRYLRSASTPEDRVGFPARLLQDASLDLAEAVTVAPDTKIEELLAMLPPDNTTNLWLVVDAAHPERLLGVFTPFDLL